MKPIESLRLRGWVLAGAMISAVVPAVAVHLAYLINIHFGAAELCLPYWDGCTSISRAVRSGPGLMVFRLMMAPAAVALILTWLLLHHGLRFGGWTISSKLRWQTCLGMLGGVFLLLYVNYLGEPGPIYRWLRRYGVYGYFGFTALALLLLSAQLGKLPMMGSIPGAMMAPVSWLRRLTFALWGFGVGFAFRDLLPLAPDLLDRMENAVEWLFALLLSLALLALARLLHELQVRLAITVRMVPTSIGQ